MRQEPRTVRHPGAHPGAAPAVAGLIALVAATSGCGLSVLGHKVDVRGLVPGGAPRGADAVAEAREQAARAPREPYGHYRVARLQLAADSTANAEAALKASLACDPLYAPALSLISKLYFDQRRHTEAIALLAPACSRTDAFPGGVPAALLAGLALHYDAVDRPDLARAVLAGMPHSDRRATASAEVYVALRGDAPDAAAGLASEAVNRDRKSAANQNNFGIARLRAGDPTAARQAFLAAIEIDPALPGPYYNLAILEKYYALDDAAGAKWFGHYRRRATADPDGLAEVFGQPGPKDLAGKEAQP